MEEGNYKEGKAKEVQAEKVEVEEINYEEANAKEACFQVVEALNKMKIVFQSQLCTPFQGIPKALYTHQWCTR